MTQNLLPARPEPADLGAPARRQRSHRTPPSLRLLDTLVLAGLGLTAIIAQAQTPVNLVLDTGNNTALPSRITSNGAPILRVGPSNPTATFNGVTIRYLGTQSVTTLVSNPISGGPTAAGTMGRFIVLGDLNLAANQKIFGVGPNLVQLEVGNNAKIAAGATIDFSGQGQIAGAGGGGGGTAPPDAAVGYRISPSSLGPDGGATEIFPFGGAGGYGATNYNGRAGLSIAQPYYATLADARAFVVPGTLAYRDLFRSNAGGTGQAGQGNLATAAGGVQRVHSGFLPSNIDPGVAEFVVATAGVGGTGGQRGYDNGFGASGDNGRNGGNGGTGGNGTGGTGGVVQIAASSFTFNGYTDVSGGRSGNGLTESAHGASYFNAFSGQGASYNSPTYFGISATGNNPYRSFANSAAFGGLPAGQVPNLPSIIGGAAPYGLLTGETAAPGSTTQKVAEGIKALTDFTVAPVAGHKRVGAITRVNAELLSTSFGIAGYDNNSQQVILFSAFGANVARPALMAVDPLHQAFPGDDVPSGPQPLRHGNGYLNDPSLTAGAVAPTDMAALPAWSTFAMYASGTQNVTASFTPYTAPRYFTGTPTPSGSFGLPGASTVFLEDRGLLRLGVVASSNDTGQAAGTSSVRETTGSFATAATANLRAGGSNIIFVSAQGVGSVDTATSGNATVRTLQNPSGAATVPGPLQTQGTVRSEAVGRGQFWGSAAFALNTQGLAIGTTQRVAEVDFTPEYDDTTRTITAAVDARIFGPSPRLQGAGTSGNSFTFASIQAGTAVISRFSLQNADVLSSLGSVWANAINADPELIHLTVLGFELIDTAGVFTVNGLGNAPLPFALDGNQTAPVDIRFSPTNAGNYTATLRFLTDMNAPLGQAGNYYTVSLFATAVDEPPALLLLLGGGLALWLRRRVQRRAH